MKLRRLPARVANALLDRSIVFSFDRTGYLRHRRRFDPTDLSVDLRGKRALVTGANSGIGKATAAALVARNATVHLLCRNRPRADAARDDLLRQHPGADVHVNLVDLSDTASVIACCDALAALSQIDLLIHNAGVLANTHRRAPDGREQSLKVNLIEPYRMTRRLLPQLHRAEDARIIFVSSGGMYSEKLSVRRLEMEPRGFDGVTAYARAKRAQVVLTEQLSQELQDTPITVHSMHPGWADTPAVRSSLPTFHRFTRRILRSPEEGADTVIWLAVCPRVAKTSGQFWFDRAPQPTHLLPTTRHRPAEEARLMQALDAWIATA